MKDARIIIQGFGNAGSFLAKFLKEKGARIVGISDAHGALYNVGGLDIDYLLERRDRFGSVTNLFHNRISNKELLEKECDILVPAAIANQLTADNAANIQASIIVEAANGPTTWEATEILSKRGILIIPDVLASAGGVTVSYFEWVQNNQGFYWTKEEVADRMRDVLITSMNKVYLQQQKNIK